MYWTTSANNGSAVTSYKVTSVQDTSKHCTATTSDSCVVTGLSNTTLYSFTVVTIKRGCEHSFGGIYSHRQHLRLQPEEWVRAADGRFHFTAANAIDIGKCACQHLGHLGPHDMEPDGYGRHRPTDWNGNSNRGSVAPTGVLRLIFQKGQRNPGGTIQTSFVR